MPNTGMNPEYPLNALTIALIVPSSIGAYALGYKDLQGVFNVKYVGRSDTDINARLQQHLNKGYSFFEYETLPNAYDAFCKECNLYHDFGERELLDNQEHPDRPEGTNYQCPRCNIFNNLNGYYI